MKRIIFIVFLASICSLFAFTDEINWVYDLKKGLGEAKSANKVAMIDVYTDWCYWCKELDAKTYKDKKVISLSKSFVNVKVNPEKDKGVSDFIKKYNVEGYPAILFVEHTGVLILKIAGFLAAGPFLKKMEEVPRLQAKINLYKKEIESGNTAHAIEFLDILVKSSRFDEAVPVFDKIREDKKFSKSQLGDYYIQIGVHFAMKNEYEKGKKYFIEAESLYPDTFNGFISSYYHAYTEYLTGNKENAVSIISKALRNPKLPPELRKDFENVLKAFKEQSK